ncbi:ALP1-like protein isoform X1 [Tanacetum coccineum]|uniref:ALP1-like protein isoform X1 n=1 Tax=Tanacetum coccineum TaxID=301880 RepID=A0ABQ5HLS9_9ASTR
MKVEESLNVKFDETPPPSSPPLIDDDLLEVDIIENQRGSSSGPIRRRRYIYREQEEAEERLIDDYIGDDEYEPKYPEEMFRRSSWLDATSRKSIGPILKCTSAIRQLAYDTAPDAFDEYLQIVERANNDLNVLYGSPLFDDELADTALECPFVVNGHTYRKCYYLADGIYPAWSTFVKSFSVARDKNSLKFKRVQEAARKDIERAFGVLQGSSPGTSSWNVFRNVLLNDVRGRGTVVPFPCAKERREDYERRTTPCLAPLSLAPFITAHAAYEHYVALCEQEAGGSSSGPKRRRTYIPRERETAEQRLMDDYFGDEEFEPKYPEENFRRRYRMSSTLFNKIVNKILSYDVEPIPEYFTYFTQRYDATGRLSIGPIMKCTSAIRQLAYGTAPDAFDEYLQIAERTSRECLDNFTKCIHVLFAETFLRKPTRRDIEKTYQLHEQKHGLPGMLGSIDWANNDLNVLYGSPLFDDELADTAPECPFVVNGHTYRKCYYLADGIYPAWSTFVKSFSVARDEKSLKFKRVQEAARKDIERAFGVLQGRWGIIRQPARAYQINMLKKIMYCCIMLHNMILEDEGFEVNVRDLFISPTPHIQRNWVERCELHLRKSKELRDRKTHIDLRQDLVENLWNNH